MISAGVMVMGSLSLWSETKSPSPDPTSWWMCNLVPWTGRTSPHCGGGDGSAANAWHACPRRHYGHEQEKVLPPVAAPACEGRSRPKNLHPHGDHRLHPLPRRPMAD